MTDILFIASRLHPEDVARCVAEAHHHLLGRDDLAPHVVATRPDLRCLDGGRADAG